ncbi:hypothetical protein HZH66_014313 [Vespula vulgaris]|uniref:Uncharacterized protein n=1 Tax=Vespula vulgaris TaxID=7454 RepID=A0A834J5F4_VESVU|nr:hypothetical protein HZH66_014313 [Vespula vulgaris]
MRTQVLPGGYACAETDRCFLLANCCTLPRSEAASDLPKKEKRTEERKKDSASSLPSFRVLSKKLVLVPLALLARNASKWIPEDRKGVRTCELGLNTPSNAALVSSNSIRSDDKQRDTLRLEWRAEKSIRKTRPPSDRVILVVNSSERRTEHRFCKRAFRLVRSPTGTTFLRSIRAKGHFLPRLGTVASYELRGVKSKAKRVDRRSGTGTGG